MREDEEIERGNSMSHKNGPIAITSIKTKINRQALFLTNSCSYTRKSLRNRKEVERRRDSMSFATN